MKTKKSEIVPLASVPSLSNYLRDVDVQQLRKRNNSVNQLQNKTALSINALWSCFFIRYRKFFIGGLCWPVRHVREVFWIKIRCMTTIAALEWPIRIGSGMVFIWIWIFKKSRFSDVLQFEYSEKLLYLNIFELEYSKKFESTLQWVLSGLMTSARRQRPVCIYRLGSLAGE